MGRNLKKKQSIYWIISIVLFVFALYKTTIGIHSDEIHSVAVGDMIARGGALFRECWFYLQLSAVVSAPLEWIYYSLTGSNEGIILFTRVCAVIVQGVVAVFLYKTFANDKNKFWTFAAAICMFTFYADFLNFGYKPELIWFTTLEICFAYRYFISANYKNLIGLGISLSLCVLCFPTTVLQALVWVIVLFVYTRKENKNVLHFLVLPLVCLVCAGAFFLFVFSKISIKDFFTFFPEIMSDDQLASNFWTKLEWPVKKMVELGLLSGVPVLLCKKISILRKLVVKFTIPVFTILLVLAFAGQCYIERLGITWHCITYPYSLTMFFMPILFFSSKDRKKTDNKWCFVCFFLMAWISFLCISLASNQGNITCIYAGVFSTCGMLILTGNLEDQGEVVSILNEKRIISVAMIIMALLMFIFPVWDQEAIEFEKYGMRSIFSSRVKMTSGPAKGIWVGEEMYDRVSSFCDEIDMYVGEEDRVYLIEDGFYTAFGYLHQPGIYATYSPRGQYSDRIVQYYDVNPQQVATVIIVSKKCLDDRGDDYTFPKGKALQEIIDTYDFSRYEDDRFIVFKR